jgi:hypothetical protein
MGSDANKAAGVYEGFLQQTSLKRGIGRRELWDSLPVASKLFTCLLLVDVLLCVYTLIHQLQQASSQRACADVLVPKVDWMRNETSEEPHDDVHQE